MSPMGRSRVLRRLTPASWQCVGRARSGQERDRPESGQGGAELGRPRPVRREVEGGSTSRAAEPAGQVISGRPATRPVAPRARIRSCRVARRVSQPNRGSRRMTLRSIGLDVGRQFAEVATIEPGGELVRLIVRRVRPTPGSEARGLCLVRLRMKLSTPDCRSRTGAYLFAWTRSTPWRRAEIGDQLRRAAGPGPLSAGPSSRSPLVAAASFWGALRRAATNAT
jgi:hypothetical protein